MLTKIENTKAEMRKSEQKVADFVLANPNTVITLSIAALASKVGVSEPTVIRFCRALGFSGYQDFKLGLAQNLASSARYFHREIQPGDETAEMAGKIFNNSIAVMARARNNLRVDDLNHAIDLLAHADRIEFYTQDNAAIVSQEIQHKFLPLGLSMVIYTDSNMHKVAAGHLRPGCVAVILSVAGTNPDVIHSARLARELGADVIGIAPGDSPLSEYCTVLLNVEEDHQGEQRRTHFASLVQIILLDILAAGVSTRREKASPGTSVAESPDTLMQSQDSQ